MGFPNRGWKAGTEVAMERPHSSDELRKPPALAPDAGVILILVLGLLSLLAVVGLTFVMTLFPLGALQMAEDVQDDRTAAIAGEATIFSRDGLELSCRTRDFVLVSLANGSADPDTAGQLRQEYETLALRATDLEARLEELRQVFPPHQIQRHAGPLLAQIRLIELRVSFTIQLLSLIEHGEVRTMPAASSAAAADLPRQEN
jgi:hypothetical protein